MRRLALAPIVAFALSVGAVSFAATPVPPIPAPPGEAPPAQFPSDGANGGTPVDPPPPPAVPPQTPPDNAPGTGALPPIAPGAGGMESATPPAGDPNVSHDPDQYNRPGVDWYQDMYTQIYYSAQYFKKVEYWAHNTYYYYRTHGGNYDYYKDIYELYEYASYMRYYFESYFWNYYGYDQNHQYIVPRYFDFKYEGHNYHSYAWRGDFTYNYKYYIESAYHNYLKAAGKYYAKHHRDNDYNRDYGYGRYSDHHGYAKGYYHGYRNCVRGKMSTDNLAEQDPIADSLEAAAGQ
jgi:hypothetical protein